MMRISVRIVLASFLVANVFHQAFAFDVSCAYDYGLKNELNNRGNFVYVTPDEIEHSLNFEATGNIISTSNIPAASVTSRGLTAEISNVFTKASEKTLIPITIKTSSDTNWGLLNIVEDIIDPNTMRIIQNLRPGYDELSESTDNSDTDPRELTVNFEIVPTPTNSESPVLIPDLVGDNSAAGGGYEYMSMGYVTRSDDVLNMNYFVNALFYATYTDSSGITQVVKESGFLPEQYHLFALCVTEYKS